MKLNALKILRLGKRKLIKKYYVMTIYLIPVYFKGYEIYSVNNKHTQIISNY